MKNHGQTLQRLAERGGLSWSEAYAVLTDSDYPRKKDYVSEEYYKENWFYCNNVSCAVFWIYRRMAKNRIDNS